MRRAAIVLVAAALVCGTASAARSAGWKTLTVRKSAGDVTAVMTVQKRKVQYGATASRNLHLTVTVGGKTVLDRSLCTPLRCGIMTQQILSLHRLSGSTPDVLLDYYTGGAHCCFWTLFVLPSGKTIAHDWGNPGYRVVTHGGLTELVSADDRFAYEFTAFAASGLPVEVWRITPAGSLVNVTSTRPDLVTKDAAVWWKAYLSERGKPEGDVRGVLAAWCADQYLLGHKAACVSELVKARARGWLAGAAGWPSNGAYIALLDKVLAHWGY